MKPTPTDTHCPTLDELRRLLQAGLPDAEATRLRACPHLSLLHQTWQTLQTETVLAPHRRPLYPTADTNHGHEPHCPPRARPATARSSGNHTWKAPERPETAERRPPPAYRRDRVRSPSFLRPAKRGELGWLGHYRITARAGEGGMGFVLRCLRYAPASPRCLERALKPDLAANDRSVNAF